MQPYLQTFPMLCCLAFWYLLSIYFCTSHLKSFWSCKQNVCSHRSCHPIIRDCWFCFLFSLVRPMLFPCITGIVWADHSAVQCSEQIYFLHVDIGLCCLPVLQGCGMLSCISSYFAFLDSRLLLYELFIVGFIDPNIWSSCSQVENIKKGMKIAL